MSRSDDEGFSPSPRSTDAHQTPRSKEKYILSTHDLRYFPPDMHKALQKEADGIWKHEARLPPGGEGRNHRDFLKKLRVFLVKLDPHISIVDASMHPLTNGENLVICKFPDALSNYFFKFPKQIAWRALIQARGGIAKRTQNWDATLGFFARCTRGTTKIP